LALGKEGGGSWKGWEISAKVRGSKERERLLEADKEKHNFKVL